MADTDMRIEIDAEDGAIETTLADFLVDNNGIDPDEAHEIGRALTYEGVYRGGGGAAPIYELRRIDSDRPVRRCGFAGLTDNPYMKKLFARIDREVEARERSERDLYHSMGARTMGEVFGSIERDEHLLERSGA